MPFGLNPLTLERDVPIDERGNVVGPLADAFLRTTGYANAWDWEASRDPKFVRPGATTTTTQAGAVAALLAALTAAGFNVGTTTTTTQPAPQVLPPTIAAFRKTFPQPSGRNWTNLELEAIRASYKAKFGVDPGAHVWTAGNAPAPDYLSNRAIVPNAPAAPVAAATAPAALTPAAITATTPAALSLTWYPDYAVDMVRPAGGVNIGQLLAPNYLTRTIARGGEEAPQRIPVRLDPNQVERSFREQVGLDIRAAIRDVAPGFDIPAGPVTLATLNTVVRDDQVRAPAKDEAFGPLLAAALIAATVATAGGAAAAGAAAGGAASGAGGAASSFAEFAAAVDATEAATGAAMLSNAGMTYADVLTTQALGGSLSLGGTLSPGALSAATQAAQSAAGSAVTAAATAASGGVMDAVVRAVAGIVPAIVTAIRPSVAPVPVEPALVTLPPNNTGVYLIGGAVALLAVALLAKGS